MVFLHHLYLLSPRPWVPIPLPRVKPCSILEHSNRSMVDQMDAFNLKDIFWHFSCWPTAPRLKSLKCVVDPRRNQLQNFDWNYVICFPEGKPASTHPGQSKSIWSARELFCIFSNGIWFPAERGWVWILYLWTIFKLNANQAEHEKMAHPPQSEGGCLPEQALWGTPPVRG